MCLQFIVFYTCIFFKIKFNEYFPLFAIVFSLLKSEIKNFSSVFLFHFQFYECVLCIFCCLATHFLFFSYFIFISFTSKSIVQPKYTWNKIICSVVLIRQQTYTEKWGKKSDTSIFEQNKNVSYISISIWLSPKFLPLNDVWKNIQSKHKHKRKAEL